MPGRGRSKSPGWSAGRSTAPSPQVGSALAEVSGRLAGWIGTLTVPVSPIALRKCDLRHRAAWLNGSATTRTTGQWLNVDQPAGSACSAIASSTNGSFVPWLAAVVGKVSVNRSGACQPPWAVRRTLSSITLGQPTRQFARWRPPGSSREDPPSASPCSRLSTQAVKQYKDDMPYDYWYLGPENTLYFSHDQRCRLS